jgi:hypothetical protein
MTLADIPLTCMSVSFPTVLASVSYPWLCHARPRAALLRPLAGSNDKKFQLSTKDLLPAICALARITTSSSNEWLPSVCMHSAVSQCIVVAGVGHVIA